MSDALAITTTAAGVRVDLRVMPRSPRTGLAGVRGGRLLVRVTAPPVDNAANDAVVSALADALDLPRRSIRITSGGTGRNKTVEIAGVTEAVIRARLLASDKS